MSVCGTGLWQPNQPINPDLNASALTATAGFSGIHVRWTINSSSLPNISHTQIYRGMSEDFALAVPLQRVKGDYYFDAIVNENEEVTYYYWIKHTASDGQTGNLIGPASALWGSPVSSIIAALEGQLEATHLSQALKSELLRLDILDSSLANEVLNRTNGYNLLTEVLDAAASDFEGVRTALISETQARELADSAQIDSINILGARVDGTEAAIVTQQTVIADFEQAYAQDILALGGRIDNAESALVIESTTRATENEAYASKVEALTSRVNEAESNISEEIITRANRDNALAASILNMDAGLDGRIGAAISKIDYASVAGFCEIGGNPDVSKTDRAACEAAGGTWNSIGSIAATLSTYAVQTDSQVAGIETTVGVYGDEINGLKAEYLAKTSVTAPNGTQLIGGFGLYNDGITVDAAFEVDRFWIGSSSASAGKPFMVVGGAVYMNTAYIQNASIDSAKIADAAITSAKIGNLSVTSAHIENLTVGTQKIADNAVSEAVTVSGVTNWSSFALTSSGSAESILLVATWKAPNDGQYMSYRHMVQFRYGWSSSSSSFVGTEVPLADVEGVRDIPHTSTFIINTAPPTGYPHLFVFLTMWEWEYDSLNDVWELGSPLYALNVTSDITAIRFKK